VKFLCIPCDTQMVLRSTSGPDRGSVSLVYACPTCGYGIAMLTNPHETQVVRSLGVQIAPESAAAAGKCPVTGMLRELESAAGAPTHVMTEAAAAAPHSQPPHAQEADTVGELPWSSDARARLEAIPELVRPMARLGVERFAREHGYERITPQVLERARSHFGL
jgi:predicted RNA-binding Zn-ribbon protein involved in translation (DUF1610 family)